MLIKNFLEKLVRGVEMKILIRSAIIAAMVVSNTSPAQSFAPERQKLIDGLGGFSKTSFCKLAALNVNVGASDKSEMLNFAFHVFAECLITVNNSKGTYSDPEQWKKSFEGDISQKLSSWANELSSTNLMTFVTAVVSALKEKEALHKHLLTKVSPVAL